MNPTGPEDEAGDAQDPTAEVSGQRLAAEEGAQACWTDEELSLLGKLPDGEVALRTGREAEAVQWKRLSLRIPSFRGTLRNVHDPVEPEKVTLAFGPYAPPRTRRGKFLFCELRGTVKVGDFSNGPIPWPMKHGTRSIILCGDLIRAVRNESEIAVAYQWGVCLGVVGKWRRALEVGPMTPGTRRLKSSNSSKAMTALLRAHLTRVKVGKPIRFTPEGKARAVAARRRPRTERWYESMAKHFAARRGKLVDPSDKPWTPEEEKFLGTRPDKEVAVLLNRSVGAVTSRRLGKKIAYRNPTRRPWTAAELEMLGKVADREIARRTGHPLLSVRSKRRKLGYLVRPHPKPWTPEEEKLLGTGSDRQVAEILKRSEPDVNRRRVALSIAPCPTHPLYDFWTREEDKLLGTASDAEIAARIGRGKGAVQARRLALGLPSHREQRRLSNAKQVGVQRVLHQRRFHSPFDAANEHR